VTTTDGHTDVCFATPAGENRRIAEAN